MKIGIAGCTGRMGQLLDKEISIAPDLYLAGGTTREKEIFKRCEIWTSELAIAAHHMGERRTGTEKRRPTRPRSLFCGSRS